MRKFLIVSPRFPPTNAPDLHRIRASLAYYRLFGWEPTILCIDPETADGVLDASLAQSVPEDTRIKRVGAWREEQCRRFLGFGHLHYRCLVPLYFAGCELLETREYELVFFSTTVFPAFVLGRLWKRRYGCKIVFDFQDPWYREAHTFTRQSVPGRWWKYLLDRALARHLEKFALRAADHVVAVSEGYATDLARRYTWLKLSMFTVLPFGGTDADYHFLDANDQHVSFNDQRLHWVYAGRGGPDMESIFRALFQSVALMRNEAAWVNKVLFHFVGTNYAPASRTQKVVEPLARTYHVEDLVDERSERVPYFEALSLYKASAGILLIGSTDGDYFPSKLIPIILSRKPILALLRDGTRIAEVAAGFANVFVASFRVSPEEPSFRTQLESGLQWLRSVTFDETQLDEQLRPWSALEMTRRQCAVFDLIA